MPKPLTEAQQFEQWALNAEAEELQTELGRRAACYRNPAPFMDYEDRADPVVFEAQMACTGCDFLFNCRERARLEKPVWGVWGGEVWDGTHSSDGRGRIVRRARKRQIRGYAAATADLV